MKKWVALLLAVAMLTCLCACGDKSDKDDTQTVTTTQPVGDTDGETPSTKVYYKTDAAGSTITTVIVLPEEGETFPIKTAAPAADVVRAAASFTADTLFFLNGTDFGDEEEDMDD